MIRTFALAGLLMCASTAVQADTLSSLLGLDDALESAVADADLGGIPQFFNADGSVDTASAVASLSNPANAAANTGGGCCQAAYSCCNQAINNNAGGNNGNVGGGNNNGGNAGGGNGGGRGGNGGGGNGGGGDITINIDITVNIDIDINVYGIAVQPVASAAGCF